MPFENVLSWASNLIFQPRALAMPRPRIFRAFPIRNPSYRPLASTKLLTPGSTKPPLFRVGLVRAQHSHGGSRTPYSPRLFSFFLRHVLGLRLSNKDGKRGRGGGQEIRLCGLVEHGRCSVKRRSMTIPFPTRAFADTFPTRSEGKEYDSPGPPS